jgi:hypothetical protein
VPDAAQTLDVGGDLQALGKHGRGQGAAAGCGKDALRCSRLLSCRMQQQFIITLPGLILLGLQVTMESMGQG